MFRFWLAASLMLLAILAASAHALTEAEATASPADAEASLSEEFESEDECATAGDEDEAEEECEVEAEGTGFSPAEDCYLRTAKARVVAYPSREMMRLTVGYTTYTPAQATVEFGAKGDPHLGTVRRQLGRSGVVRLSKHLGDKAMAELQNSHRFTVTVHVPEAPRRCQRFEVQRLQVERSSDSQVTWSEDG
jgi:hypothetical protein